MRQAYLSYTGPELRVMGGVGDFSKDLPPLPVSDSIANQYESEEMKSLGWVVERRGEAQEDLSPEPLALSPEPSAEED